MERPTIRDIARLTGLSVPTVSKALNEVGHLSEDTRRRVKECAEEIGYVQNFMASQVRRRESRMVGILVSDLSQPFFSSILDACEETLSKAGYQPLLFNSFEDPDKEMMAVRKLVSLGAAGCLIDLVQNTRGCIPFMREFHMPYVLFGRRLKEDEDCYVVPDNRAIGYEATRHLLLRAPGRPIVCVDGPDGISPTTERHDGFVRALGEMEPGAQPAHVYENCFGMAEGYQAGIDAARRVPTPFNAFCSTDRIATGFIRGLNDGGLRVPQDVRVVGVDDIDEARYLVPSLTTVAIPKREIAQESTRMLMRLIAGAKLKTAHVLLQGALVQRESS